MIIWDVYSVFAAFNKIPRNNLVALQADFKSLDFIAEIKDGRQLAAAFLMESLVL